MLYGELSLAGSSRAALVGSMKQNLGRFSD